MVDVIRKDNLTDLIHATPPSNGGNGNQPTQQTPQQQPSGNQGKPAPTATGSNGEVITLGQESIKVK